MRVQRFRESVFSTPNSNVFALAAKNSPDRIYLRFSTVTTAATVMISSSQNASVTNAQVIAGTGAGQGFWELFKYKHGVMVTQEWYVATNVPGVATFSLFEVFEEDTVPGTPNRRLQPLGVRRYGVSDMPARDGANATRWRDAIRQAERLWASAGSKNKANYC